MKKKLTLFILIVLIPVFAWASGGLVFMSPGISGLNAGCYEDATFSYNGDHTSGTNYACDSIGVAINGTVFGATVTANYVLSEDRDEYLTFAVDSSEIAVGSGTYYVSIYIVDADADTHVGSVNVDEIGRDSWDSTNHIRLVVAGDGDGNGRLHAVYIGAGNNQTVYAAADGIALGTWYRVGYTWDSSRTNEDHALSVVACGGTTEADCSGVSESWGTAADDITNMENDVQVITLGEKDSSGTMTDDIRIADIAILSGWQTTDPF